MTLILCGVFPEKATGLVTCPCCGETRKPHEEDMSNMCFWCLGGDNVNCARCLKEGIMYTRFGEDDPTAHVIHEPAVDGLFTAACGTAQIRYEEMTGWGAPGTKFCGTCAPEMEDFQWPSM